MKSLIIATTLLALVSPVHAAKANPKDFPLMDKWRDNFWICRNTDDEKACALQGKLEKKLSAKGYCTYARGQIGRAGKPWTQKELDALDIGPASPDGSRHCYVIDNYIPSVE